MSDRYTNTSGGSDTYNAGAAHDSGFYDPDLHDNEIVAVFADAAAARAARDALVSAGTPENQVQVVDRVSGDAAPGASQAEDKAVGDQILTAIVSLFGGHDDRNDYTHAVNQGHAMVVVTPSGDTDRHRVIQVLESSHPIDFDAKLAEWRQAGYDRSGAPRSPEHATETRASQRETMPNRPEGQSRIRSYIANRPDAEQTTPATEAGGTAAGDGMGTGGAVTNATPGATSSGTNSPRR